MWFHSIFSSANSSSAKSLPRSKRRRSARRRPTACLQLEPLETRCLLSFSPAASYPVGSSPQAIATADFNGDGKADIVTANTNSNTVSVLINNGDGTFGTTENLAVGVAPVSVAVGDFNDDGKLDIVTANQGAYYSGTLSVLLGNGDGTFQPAEYFSAGVNPQSVAVGDFNHDGKLDLVTANEGFSYSGNSIGVLLGNGDGTFQPAQQLSVPNYPLSIAVGDMNHDGKLDLVETGFIAYGYSAEAEVDVLLGNGDGTFAPANSIWAGSNYYVTSPVLGDFNGDGNLDVAVLDGGDVELFAGWGTGTLHPGSFISTPVNISYDGLAVGDFNHDGKLDLATDGVVNLGAGGTGNGGAVLLGNGDGTFKSPVADDLGPGGPVAAGDFNGDQFPDLAAVYPASDAVAVSLNAADWSTTPPTATSFAVSGFPTSTIAGTSGNFTVTSLNPDGTIDTGYAGTVRFSSSDGQAALPAAYTFTASDAGVHTFSATLKTAGTQSISATDTSTGTLTGSETGITVTPAAASHFAVSAQAGSTAGSALSVTVTALDPYNNTATGYVGTVHFTSSDGQASLPGDYNFTGTGGVHTFTSAITLKTAGSQTVTATDASTATLAGSAAVTVSPAAASVMIVSGFPSPIIAGVAGGFTVTLKDTYGNIASGYTGTVHFTSSDAKAVLPANYTFTSADAGNHTFSAALKTAGTQSITAADTVNASLHSTDSGITVKAAAASKFILSAPASVQPGVPFSLTVTVEDAYGNIVTGYLGTIHFTSSDSRAKLPANYTFTAGDNGVHTFTGLVLKKKGNDTITVTDTQNSSITGKTVVNVL